MLRPYQKNNSLEKDIEDKALVVRVLDAVLRWAVEYKSEE